jgi:hypothetical protein
MPSGTFGAAQESGVEVMSNHPIKRPDRFKAFNPDERLILLTLLQEHCNAVSQIAAGEHRVSAYLLAIERLEAEAQE